MSDNSLDSILTQIGDFGKYQIFTYTLVCIAVIMHSAVHVGYVFTALNLDYRCLIPECDGANPQYNPEWLKNAVPFTEEKPSSCLRYAKNATAFNNCTSREEFTSKNETCHDFVYRTTEHSILQEFDLHCEENLWKLTLVGTINSSGQFFGMYLAGALSDRFGRKIVLILGMMLCGICGIIRSFSPSYTFFLVFEFMDAFFGSGSYICGFIIGVELVGPSKRVLTGTLLSSCYAVGEVVTSTAAYFTKSWRALLYVLYVPPLFLFSYFWLIPESVRWNISKGRIDKAKETLKRVARVNKKEISEASLRTLNGVEEETSRKYEILQFCKSPLLMLRLVNCCFCWITCAFIFYGLTLNSVTLAGDSYLDFILTALVEVPAYFACYFFVDKTGRKIALSSAFILSGLCCLGFWFVPLAQQHYGLVIYLTGKFGVTVAFTVTYIVTSELFPTTLRHSTMAVCSTLARIGSIVAPQTPILEMTWRPLPTVLFTTLASIAAFTVLLFPETVDVKLPETVDEALLMSKSKENYFARRITCL